MFDFITKREYFRFIEDGDSDDKGHTLKHIQDGFIIAELKNELGKKIAEIGGGNSRVLPWFSENNECWNIEKFEGKGAGPKINRLAEKNIKTVSAYMGDFSREIPDNSFDIVFSISVVEHVLNPDLHNFFLDIFRILKPGGRSYHAIDVYLGDDPSENRNYIFRLKRYIDIIREIGYKLDEEPGFEIEQARFRSSYATNSDLTMHIWNTIAPNLRHVRENTQSCSLKIAMSKPY